jgi:folate-binding protein YgfZ
MSFACLLSHRAVLQIEGAEARGFLQGLISNDIAQLAPERPLYAAILTPQGKFLYDLFIHEPSPGLLWLDAEAERMPSLIKRLTLYKLRAQLTFTDLSATHTVVVGDRPDLPPDPRLAALGGRGMVARRDVTVPSPLMGEGQGGGDSVCCVTLPLPWGQRPQPIEGGENGFATYDNHRLTLGVPEGGIDLIPDESLLLEYHFEALHGVSFTKGCYVGQEVTARTKHRATLHKQLYCVRTSGDALPAHGTPILSGEKEAGIMLSSRGGQGLALLRIARVEEGNLHAAGIEMEVALPGYVGG